MTDVPTPADVQRLLHAASQATTLDEQQRFVGEANALQQQLVAVHQAGRDVDLANAVISDHLTPVRVHEHHTAATDWIATLDTTGGAGVEHEMVAQASLWYQKVAAIKPWPEEFHEQARGQAHRLAGAFGEQAPAAEEAFLSHTARLYQGELDAGIVTVADTGSAGQATQNGLPLEDTSSERAPMIQAMDHQEPGIHDALGPNDAEADNAGAGAKTADRADTAWPPETSWQQHDQADQRSGLGPKPTLDQHHQLGYQHGAEGVTPDGTYNPYETREGTPEVAYGRGYSKGATDRLMNTRRNHRNVRYEGTLHAAQDLTGSPFSQELGRMVFGPHDDSGLQDWSDRSPILNDNGRHLYQVTTHHVGPDGSKVKDTHEMRSHRPDAHDDVEQAAFEDHSSKWGVHPNDVHVAPAMRMDRNGPVGRGTQIYTGSRKEASMQHTATCPSCGGQGRVAVQVQAASGLPQIQEVVDNNNQAHSEQAPNWDVAFPWEMQPGGNQSVIQEAESQIADREKLKGASRKAYATQVYRQIMAGQDDSGWLGDMGAGGVGPGEQDGGNAMPYSNLGQPDPVYGYGGDQGDKQNKPYGAAEANDETNNPGMNWQPGQPSQYDQGARPNVVGQPTASLIDQDPELQRALAYARQRRSYLESQYR